MSGPIVILLAILAGATAALWPRRAAAAPGFMRPPKPGALPGYAPKDYQTTCDPGEKPGAVRFRDHMVARYGGASWGITRECGVGGKSEHKEGRALDWHPEGSPRDKEAGWAAVKELLETDQFGRPHAEARRWGIQYLVWDGHTWHAEIAARGVGSLPPALVARGISPIGWRRYTKTGNPTIEHRDHVHFTLSREAGADAPLA